MNTKKKILVVDDDLDHLDNIAMILQADGYEVIKAGGQKDGEEAILSMIPDVAILDLMMENMDSGFVLCNHIKRLYPEVPVVLLTAVKSMTGVDFTPKSSREASWVKADVVMDKPIRPEQLRNEIKRLIG